MTATASAAPDTGRIDDGAAWEAVQARDTLLDGRLVYAVASTGIYCRPSCPSRRPRRENVAFFPTPDDAEAALAWKETLPAAGVRAGQEGRQ